MTQDWTTNVYQSDHVADTDLQNMEDNFSTIRTLFAGNSAPASPEQGLPWFDTTKEVLKYRDQSNSIWLGVMHGDTSQKLWVYRNSAMDGWAIDGTVTDKVLAFKGGSTYTTAATTAGTWTQPGHVLTIAEIPAHTHSYAAAINTIITSLHDVQTAYQIGAKTTGSTGGGASHNHGTAYRPAAAVGTMQYLDI